MNDPEILNMIVKIRRTAGNPLEMDADVSNSIAVWTLGRIFEMADYTYWKLTAESEDDK